MLVGAALLGAGTLAFAGCGSSHEAEAGEAAEIEPVSATSLPTGLAAMESGAEDVVALALSRDRARLVARASDLAETKPSALPAAASTELKRRTAHVASVARAGSFVEAALAANAISELMPGLYRRFEGRLAAGILVLDYLDREAQLRSLARQPSVAAAAVRKLSLTWARIRPGVVAAGGRDEAGAYDTHVAAMRQLARGSAARLQAEARRGLELVDHLEGVVRRR